MRARIHLLIILLIVGCDREPAATGPAIVPAQTAAPTSVPASLPSSSFFWIDQKRYEFPPVMLIVQKQGDELLVQLMSDDPPQSQPEEEPGNSLFLPMSIEAPPTGVSVAGARWKYEAPNTERADGIGGIYLGDEHKVLQPFAVTASVLEGEPLAAMSIRGTFLLFDEQDELSLPKQVAVMAELVAPVYSSRPQASLPATSPAPAPARP